MRRLLGVVVLVLLIAAVSHGQLPVGDELTCPVDGCHFRSRPEEPGDGAGGIDSDGCRHSHRGGLVPVMVVVCPRCNYTASRAEFSVGFADQHKRLILRELSTSRYRGVADSVSEIPTWERFRLAATCAVLLEHVREQIDYCNFAAWCARVESCRPATAAYSSAMQVITPVRRRVGQWTWTRGISEVIGEIEERIKSAKAPGEKHRLMLHLAMMCQRGGFAARRDEVLARLSGADKLFTAKVDRFKELVAVETEFQNQLIGLLRKRLKEEEEPDRRVGYTYLLADTLRRLNRRDEAVEAFRAARKFMPTPTEMRLYTDHFLSRLAPGEPLPVPGPTKPVSTDAKPTQQERDP